MAIFRRKGKREPGFGLIPKEVLDNETLSFKAKGILGYALSKPHNWKLRPKEILKHGSEGPHANKSGIKELVSAGYLKLITEKDTKGRFVDRYYDAYEIPSSQMTESAENPKDGKPHLGGKSIYGKNPSYNKKDSYKEKDFNKKKRIEKEVFDFQFFLRVWRARSTKKLVEAWDDLTKDEISSIEAHLSKTSKKIIYSFNTPLDYLQGRVWKTAHNINPQIKKSSKYDIKC